MRSMRRTSFLPFVALAFAACADSTTGPSAPQLTAPRRGVVGEAGFVLVKKIGPVATYTFDLSASQGIFSNGNPVTVNAFEWTRFWEAVDPTAPITSLDIFERLAPNMKVDSAWITPIARAADGILTDQDNFKQLVIGTNQLTVPNVGYDNGAYVIIYNSEGKGGAGCTPGYWRQEHHYDSWVGYTPTQTFKKAFGVDAFPGMTLGQVVRINGGGLNALGRHAVAALLNSTSLGGDYPMTTKEVIALFQSAYKSGSYEQAKNTFANLNERNCYLN
jgi:hypothetical protein